MDRLPRVQPAKAILAQRRISNRAIAEAVGCSALWVGKVLNGYSPPPEKFRRALSDILELPQGELFYDVPALTRYPGNDEVLFAGGDAR